MSDCAVCPKCILPRVDGTLDAAQTFIFSTTLELVFGNKNWPVYKYKSGFRVRIRIVCMFNKFRPTMLNSMKIHSLSLCH